MKSKCPNKERCGSCKWSHIPYEEQLQTKLGEIQKALRDAGTSEICDTILPSPKIDHYRNRMDFTIDFEGRVGLREKGKWWRTIDGHHCFISDEKIEEAFSIVQQWVQEASLSFFDRKSHVGLLRYATIRATTLGEVMVTIITSKPESEEAKAQDALKKLAEATEIDCLVWAENHTTSDTSTADITRTIKGSGSITEHVEGYKYIINPLSFFQSNSHGAATLLNEVMKRAEPLKEKRIVDLYCGSGFFTIPLAQNAQEIFGVEIVPEAIEMAKKNALLNEVDVKFEAAKSEESSWEEIRPEVLILDPPRSGMHPKALSKVLETAPENIIYVSCNYREFSKDLIKLREHYDLVDSTAIDMFPHTPHVELVSRLDRR